mgnify:CR=1 FL=1
MATVTTVLALLAACIGFALLARWLKVPYAAVLVLGGMALAFVPGVPEITLDPALALAFFLPPLLQGSAWRTDWRAFRSELRPILLLAVGAVLFSALCVAVVAKLLLPGLPWAAAIALGAIVAPPDAVAASAVLRGLSMPRRLVVILEGESLVNDATALILYRFSLAALAAGAVAIETAALSFVIVAAGGLLLGYAIGRAAVWAIARTNDTLLETLLSFLACYAAFLAGEWAGVSGVIAVVTAGIVLGQRQSAFSARTRIESVAVWRFVEFVLTSLIFILVGLQLQGILERLGDRDPLLVAGVALGVSAALIGSRFLWVFPVGWIEGLFARSGPRPDPRHLTIMSWAGMRGVVSLAAALGLPLETPERDLIVFAAFVAILVTLVAQGTTLGPLIRRLKVEVPPTKGLPPEEAEAWRVVRGAMRDMLEARAADPLDGAIAADLLPEYQDRARLYAGVTSGATGAELSSRLALRLEALRAGREALAKHRRASTLSDETLTAIRSDLDLEELRLRRLLSAI